MAEIKNITISGFSGINYPPLELDFCKDKLVESMIIYGRNGTGKSSIVNSWEWFFAKKIEWLAREGAGESSYPNINSGPGDTFIEIEFLDSALGTIKMEYDNEKMTKPIITGAWDRFKEKLPYICHLRQRDLINFIYHTKTERYETLAHLIGFDKSLRIQNDLIRCYNKTCEILENNKKLLDDIISKFRSICDADPLDKVSIIKKANEIFNRHKLPNCTSVPDIKANLEHLKNKVEKDKLATDMAYWKDISHILSYIYPLDDIAFNIKEFKNKYKELEKDESELKKLFLINLYEAGLEAIQALDISDICPLCDSKKPDLKNYIILKQSKLSELKNKRGFIDSKKEELKKDLAKIIPKLEISKSRLEKMDLDSDFQNLLEKIYLIIPSFEAAILVLEKEFIDVDLKPISEMRMDKYKEINDIESDLKKTAAQNIYELEKDTSRKSLVEDFQNIHEILDLINNFEKINKRIKDLTKIITAFKEIKDDFIEECKKYIQDSFDTVSSDLATFFSLLEPDLAHIDKPRISLLSSSGKSVIIIRISNL
jgi:hypothetical protein